MFRFHTFRHSGVRTTIFYLGTIVFVNPCNENSIIDVGKRQLDLKYTRYEFSMKYNMLLMKKNDNFQYGDTTIYETQVMDNFYEFI